MKPVHEKIAIIGISLRLPGSNNLDELFRNLRDQKCFITEVPDERWQNIASEKKPDKAWGAFVEDVDGFDEEFFNVSPREAQTMDPQQRFMLELSHQAIEDAAYAPSDLAGSNTGVFMGVCHWDYAELFEKTGIDVDAYLPTGLAYSIIANRVSHHFDFTGPSVTNDSACSSALVAIIQAVQAIQLGECRQALAGGINLLLSPNHFSAFAKNGMLSKTGESRAFDKAANGYVRGEGGGVLLLKSLADAIKDQDPIHAIIDGGSSNHGGKTNSLTVTNPKAQAALIQDVYRNNGFELDSIGYIEAHGTGTPLGDPIEVLGLKMAFEALSKEKGETVNTGSCALGSIKTNMGHLEGAAGMAGVLKAVVSLKNKTLLANANFNEPNPLLKLQDSPFYVLKETQKWQTKDNKPLRAGVSAFGFGGTNAHVALQAMSATEDMMSNHQQDTYIVPISARNHTQLIKYAESLRDFIESHHDEVHLSNVAYTLQIARDHMPQRAAFVVRSLDELMQGLSQLNEQILSAGSVCFVEGSLVVIENHDADEQDIKVLLDSDDNDAIAQAWSTGVSIDWKKRYDPSNLPRRIHAPVYVFAKNRHWFVMPDISPNVSHVTMNQQDYPIIQHSEKSYSVALASQHYLLKDHIIAGASILPGVVVLELVRNIASQYVLKKPEITISHVVWLRPIMAQQSIVTFRIDIQDNTFKVSAQVNAEQSPLMLCQGKISATASDDPMELINAAFDSCQDINTEQVYQRLQSAGIHHGPAFQVMDKVSRQDHAVMVSLCINDFTQNDNINWHTHPVIIDAAIQAVVALLPESTVPGIPFSVEKMTFINALSKRAHAVIRQIDHGEERTGVSRYDLDIYNSKNEISVIIRNLATKALNKAQLPVQHDGEKHPESLILAKPSWQAINFQKRDNSSNKVIKTVMLFGLTDKYRYLPTLEKTQAQDCVIEPLFLPSRITDTFALEQVLLLLVNKFKNLTKSSQKTQLILAMPSYLSSWLSPALSGLFKTINLESSLISARIVSLQNYSKPELIDELLSNELLIAQDNAEVLYSKTNQRLVKIFKGTGDNQPVPIKRKGVYWITGGSGALAQLFARHLINTGVDHVYLSGRSSRTEIADKLNTLSDIKQHISYLRVDITNREQVALALKKIQKGREGQLTGVIHAAGIINDGLLIHKNERDMSAVLAPKINGVINLDIATKHIRLDCFAVFSSIASTFGNLGQADYCVANGFLDGFMHWRTTATKLGLRFGHSSSINWPIFAEGGMHVPDNILAGMKQRMGVVPLTKDPAFQAFDYATSHNCVQLAVAYGDQATIKRFFENTKATSTAAHLKKEAKVSTAVTNQRNLNQESTNQEATSPVATSQTNTVVTSSKSDVQVKNSQQDIKMALNQMISKNFADVLAMDPNKIRMDAPFDTYGFDSIIAVELIERLEKDFGELPKTLFFEHIDLNSVVTWLMDEHEQTVHQLFSHDGVAQVESTVQQNDMPIPPSDHRVDESTESKAENTSETTAELATGLAAGIAHDLHDIAVIGIGGIYPGAKDLDEFWQNLKAGKHAFEPVPENRWKHQDIYHHERDILGKSTIKTGSFLDNIDKFDPRYFNISQTEAELMSPEVRLMLQVAVETFEDAGYSKEYIQQKMDGDVGVLVGTMSNHYNLYGFQNMLTRGSQASGSYTGTLPNMISYYYGLTGPSVFVDTMCSAAATCIDMAVRMLRTGQSKMVLAGGINLLLHPNNLVSSSQEHFTTKTAEVIRSYGVGADGTILGEGAGTVLLKPLKDAQRDGDNIQAVIRGTAITNAGVRNGFTVPNPHMQSKAIRLALDDAKINARTISYLEGHGSGTSLGDPIEIRALNKTFKEDTSDQAFCAIGSVKSNIAHLLAAAGIVGFTKALLQMRHKQLVPSLHSEKINPAINFDNSPFVVQQSLTPWQRPTLEVDGIKQQIPRRAGITSIGAGGMNSHIILQEYEMPEASSSVGSETKRLIIFSAMHLTALKRLLTKYQSWLTQHKDINLDRFAYTLQVGRTALNCRLAFMAHNLSDVMHQIDGFMNAEKQDEVFFIENVLDAQLPQQQSNVNDRLLQGNLNQWAQSWVNGAKLDWDELWHNKPLKISLPTYQFDQVRCWYEVYEDAPNILNPEAFRRKLHPFIGTNTSNIHGLSFELQFNINDVLDYQYKQHNQVRLPPLIVTDIALALSQLVGVNHTAEFQSACVTELSVSACQLHEADHLNYQVSILSDTNHSNDKAALQLQIQGFWHKNGTKQPWFDAKSAINASHGHQPLLKPLGQVIHQFDHQAILDIWQQGALSFAPYHNNIQAFMLDEHQGGEIYFTHTELHQNSHHNHQVLSADLLMLIQQLGKLLGHYFQCANWQEFDLVNLKQLTQSGASINACEKLRFSVVTHDQHGLVVDVHLLDANAQLLASFEGIEFGDLTAVIHTTQHTSSVTDQLDSQSIEKELSDYLRKQMAGIVKFPESDIHAKTGFYMLGFDSISLTTLTEKINSDYATQLTPALFYEVENLEQLTDYVVALGVKSLNKPIDNFDANSKSDNQSHQAKERTEIPDAFVVSNDARNSDEHKNIHSNDKKVRGGDSPTKFAIIGMDGKFPGANNCQEFWQILTSETDALSDFPLDRYSREYQALIAEQDFCKRGGFVRGVAEFDPYFFNVSPSEAQLMDPQHRLFLQVAWNAVEMSGYKAADLDKKTGVFVGVSANEYVGLLKDHGADIDAYMATGNSHAMLANRLSYFLDIHGPSEAIDTACSSSLVAINRAIEAITHGTCSMAIAGGVNLNLSMESFVGPHKAGMLSPEGRCKTFANDADGYVRGEGAGVVIIKPLAQAQADGDDILAVIVGSAVNHGGRANSLTAPNIKAQSDLIVSAMGDLDPSSISYIEAHGTGTHLGDPVEIEALKKAYQQLAQQHDISQFEADTCGLGSVKTNIGHLESAAGIAGLIKLILSCQNNLIPATLNCQVTNQHIDCSSSPFYVQKHARHLDAEQRHRFAVSSFGFGGANAHLVIESYQRPNKTHAVSQQQWIVLSGRTASALKQRIINLLDDIVHLKDQDMAHLAYSLQIGREAMEYRLALKTDSLTDLARQLRQSLDNDARDATKVRLINGFPDMTIVHVNQKSNSSFDSMEQDVSQWLLGKNINWRSYWQDFEVQRLRLTGYPFEQNTCWFNVQNTAAQQLSDQHEKPKEQKIEKMLQDVIDGHMDLDDVADSVGNL